MTARDQWARWLIDTRFGGDASFAEEEMGLLRSIRDRILDYARIAEGETLLDVGTGDGLVAFGALDRVGDDGRVVFSDISMPLIEHTALLAERSGHRDRSTFVQAAADDLHVIEDRSVDVVTTRSVLIYVKDKARAMREFYRVLRPGGRISLYEPVPRFTRDNEARDEFLGINVAPVAAIAMKLKDYYRKLQPDDDPAFDFDERDLAAACEEAGFTRIDLTLEIIIDTQPGAAPYDLVMHAPVNPMVPSVAEAMSEALSPEEAARFDEHVRAAIAANADAADRVAFAYVRATKGMADER